MSINPEGSKISDHMAYQRSPWGWWLWAIKGNRTLVITGCHGTPMVTRRIYFEISFKLPWKSRRPSQKGKRAECSLFQIMRHDWHRSDLDRDLHDHPWPFITYIAKGGYWEEEFDLATVIGPDQTPYKKSTWRGPGEIHFRRAGHRHAVRLNPEDEQTDRQIAAKLPAKVVSYVVAGPKFREWGFWTKVGWIDWLSFGKSRLCE